MSPMFRPFSRYLQFSGRARRSEYWLFVLLYFITAFVTGLISYSLQAAAPLEGGQQGFALTGLVWLIFMPALLSVTVRRLHDCDRSGWWILLSFVPLGVFVLLALFYVREGTRGPNRFGPEEPGEAATTTPLP